MSKRNEQNMILSLVFLLLIFNNNAVVRAGPRRREIREQTEIPPSSITTNNQDESSQFKNTFQEELSTEFENSSPNNYDNDLASSSSTHILSLVKKKKKYTSSTIPPSPSTTEETTIETTTTTDNSFETTTSFDSTEKITESSTEFHGGSPASSRWLRNQIPLINLRAALPFDILNATSEIDETSTDFGDETTSNTPFENELNATTTSEGIMNATEPSNTTISEQMNNEKSVEMIETSEEYSGEQTTQKNQHSSLMTEDASIESDKNAEANDMVFLIDLSNEEDEKNETKLENDVEMINIDELQKNATVLPKIITKRESTSDDDDIFSELGRELGLGPTEPPKSEEEDELESMKIFNELHNELKNPRKNRNKIKKTPEDEKVEKITNALGKLLLKGSLDISVLGVLRDFFSSQNKAYEIK